MNFPKPWVMHQTGRHEFVVVDAANRKLFYIVGDEGEHDENDENDIPPSALFYSEDSDFLLNEIIATLRRLDE
jgi:hypothetical protein